MKGFASKFVMCKGEGSKCVWRGTIVVAKLKTRIPPDEVDLELCIIPGLNRD